MSTADDTEIFPANAPSPNGAAAHGARTATAPRCERIRLASGRFAGRLHRFLTALLLALSVWPT